MSVGCFEGKAVNIQRSVSWVFVVMGVLLALMDVACASTLFWWGDRFMGAFCLVLAVICAVSAYLNYQLAQGRS